MSPAERQSDRNVGPAQEGCKSAAEVEALDHAAAESASLSSCRAGAGRGLQELIVGAARAATTVQLSVREIVSDAYRAELNRRAADAGLAEPIAFLPPAAPDEMASLAAEHDVGLSLERQEPLNRNLCLTNREFTYLAARRPQLMSRTVAQDRLAPNLGAAAESIDLADQADVARGSDYFTNPARRRARAFEAARLHRDRYYWEVEQETLLASVRDLIGEP